MIHFDFENRYEDELIVGSALPRRDGVLLSVIAHVLIIIWFQFGPNLHLFEATPEELEARRQELLRQQERERDDRRFVFVQPRVDLEAQQPKPKVDLSDLNRQAQARERAVKPENPLPFARGNSPERVEATPQEQAKGPESPVKPDTTPPQPEPQEQIAKALPPADTGQKRSPTTSRPAPGALGDALKNLERYVQNETFNNPQGGVNDPGATIQFDTKGVEFGPWLRRFVAQIRRNWVIPYAAMTMHGHVVVTFYVHKDGRITDIAILKPSTVDGFTHSGRNAIAASNPTIPLPTEYPDDKAFFTVTFYFNENPS